MKTSCRSGLCLVLVLVVVADCSHESARHPLASSVVQIVKKTVKEEKKDADYGDRAQAHWDKYKKKKKALKK